MTQFGGRFASVMLPQIAAATSRTPMTTVATEPAPIPTSATKMPKKYKVMTRMPAVPYRARRILGVHGSVGKTNSCLLSRCLIFADGRRG